MPRRDYKRYFARDRDGNYAGTEPEREWDESDLQREFGVYQEMALRSVPGEDLLRRGSGVGSEEGGRNGGSVDEEEGVTGRDFAKEGDGVADREGEGKGGKSEEMWWL